MSDKSNPGKVVALTSILTVFQVFGVNGIVTKRSTVPPSVLIKNSLSEVIVGE